MLGIFAAVGTFKHAVEAHIGARVELCTDAVAHPGTAQIIADIETSATVNACRCVHIAKEIMVHRCVHVNRALVIGKISAKASSEATDQRLEVILLDIGPVGRRKVVSANEAVCELNLRFDVEHACHVPVITNFGRKPEGRVVIAAVKHTAGNGSRITRDVG